MSEFVYQILVRKPAGEIVMYTNSELPDIDDPSLVNITVPEKYSNLFDDIRYGKARLFNYRVNLESKDFKIFNIEDIVESDPSYSKFSKINFLKKEANIIPDVMLSFYSKDHKPCLKVKYTGDPVKLQEPKNNSFNLYVTDVNNINNHYETFYCNFDNFDQELELHFEVNKLPVDKLFSNDFSIYYRKIFNKIYYTIL